VCTTGGTDLRPRNSLSLSMWFKMDAGGTGYLFQMNNCGTGESLSI